MLINWILIDNGEFRNRVYTNRQSNSFTDSLFARSPAPQGNKHCNCAQLFLDLTIPPQCSYLQGLSSSISLQQLLHFVINFSSINCNVFPLLVMWLFLHPVFTWKAPIFIYNGLQSHYHWLPDYAWWRMENRVLINKTTTPVQLPWGERTFKNGRFKCFINRRWLWWSNKTVIIIKIKNKMYLPLIAYNKL